MADAAPDKDTTQNSPNTEDLDLVPEDLEDEGKDDAALWQEIELAETAAPAEGSDASPPDESGGEEEVADDAGAVEGKDNSGTDNAAAGAGKDTPPDHKPDDDKSSGKDELWGNATPEQRAAHEAAQAQIKKLEQAERSNRGRLSAFQRQINELQQRQKPSADKADGKGDQDKGEGADGFLVTDDWKSFKTEYPEVSGPLEKVIGTLQGEITRLNKEMSAIGNDRRQLALNEQADILNTKHEDWRDVVADDGFVTWLETQPRHIREAAMRNADDIVDAEEAADVVGRFKEYSAAQAGGGGNADKTNSRDNTRGKGNHALTNKRQRQLDSAASTRTHTPGGASGIPEDGDETTIWKQFDEMEKRATG
jgi:hypothetical protein